MAGHIRPPPSIPTSSYPPAQPSLPKPLNAYPLTSSGERGEAAAAQSHQTGPIEPHQCANHDCGAISNAHSKLWKHTYTHTKGKGVCKYMLVKYTLLEKANYHTHKGHFTDMFHKLLYARTHTLSSAAVAHPALSY